MDHPISQLDDCIFDYLTSHPDTPKSFHSMYNDISGTSGHRCSELNDPYNRSLYKNRFLTACYTLDNKYQNIHKIFKNSIPYLIFSSKSKAEIMNDYNNQDLLNINSNDINIDYDSMIDYLLENLDQYETFDFNNAQITENETLLEHIVKSGNVDKFRKIMDMYDIDLTKRINNKSLIDVAFSSGNIQMLKELLEYQHSKKIMELTTSLSDIRRANTRLLNGNRVLQLRNKTLETTLYETQENSTFYSMGFYIAFTINILLFGSMLYNIFN
ncbi:hypothetical protein QKU48_gp1152 [Fadolivirus algeromassiliense]|jgi:hypothetical protein|uniref:Ankyrin repeat protein n=1 Tax=Fadolivirus FV1/VV64 TaxID=3070911 RepID=A0A7D3UTV4_9VIRU|nr:hypothetical protein QKU48_gp1152 [Fadolivirus algeromassiliense]QKF94610.1 hypothetical protein Fadolivirus_1_1152 [Fadolivirus FV1/VV64]